MDVKQYLLNIKKEIIMLKVFNREYISGHKVGSGNGYKL
jgi:hypothetical protein